MGDYQLCASTNTLNSFCHLIEPLVSSLLAELLSSLMKINEWVFLGVWAHLVRFKLSKLNFPKQASTEPIVKQCIAN